MSRHTLRLCECACQIDAIGGARFDDGAGGDNEVQRTMLEIVNQLDGFDSRGNIKVTGTDWHQILMGVSDASASPETAERGPPAIITCEVA